MPGIFRSLRLLWLTPLSALLLVAMACSGSSDDDPNVLATAARDAESTLSVLLMARDVEVGEARLPVVVLLGGTETTRVNDRVDDLTFSYRHADDKGFSTLCGVTWRPWPVRGGAYTAAPEFDRPGVWEVQVRLSEHGSERVGSSFIQVEQDSAAPGVGDRAPITITKTASTVDEVRQISSAFNPDPRFYAVSLDEALTNGRPTIVLFSTPAFCVTQTCGPQLDTLTGLMEQHGDSVDFIHVEIFDNIREMLDTGDSSIGEVAQAVEDWGLITEPWTFFIDSTGVISSRFEQFTTLAELSEAADRLLAAG